MADLTRIAVPVAAGRLEPAGNHITGRGSGVGRAAVAADADPRGLILYPLILAGTIYLWDTSLPPPSLPEGPPRGLAPRAILLGVLCDGLLVVSRAQRARWRAIQIMGGLLTLEDAALLCGTTMDDLRQRLERAGRTARIGDD